MSNSVVNGEIAVNTCSSKEKLFRIGQIYRNTRRLDDQNNKFLAWFKIGDFPGLDNSRGIRSMKFKYLPEENSIPAFVVLISKEGNTSTNHNPWSDVVDHKIGKIYYWGDAKYSEIKNFNEYTGNKLFEQIRDVAHKQRSKMVPPILHFATIRPGFMEFNGLCVLNRMDVAEYEDKGFLVENYKYELDILNTEVDVKWLHSRVLSKSIKEIDLMAPKVWTDYLNNIL